MLERGEINGQKVKGKWTVVNHTDEIDKRFDTNEQLVRQLDEKQQEIEYLRAELSQTNQTLANMQEGHDTIVLSFTRRFEEQTKMLEDMRGKFDTAWLSDGTNLPVPPADQRSLWSRVRTAFGFAPS